MAKHIFSCIDPFDKDLSQEGWQLKKDVLCQKPPYNFIPNLVNFLHINEDCVNSQELEAIASHHHDLAGQRDLEAMLREQASIPARWKKYYLLGPKTIWKKHGQHQIPCLIFDDDHWKLHFFLLISFYYGHFRFVRINISKASQKPTE